MEEPNGSQVLFDYWGACVDNVGALYHYPIRPDTYCSAAAPIAAGLKGALGLCLVYVCWVILNTT